MIDDGTLALRSVCFAHGSKVVFDELNFQSSRKVVGLVGRSGSGKTTLLRLIAGDLELSAGSIIRPVGSVALIAQSDGLFPWMTGIENLTFDKMRSVSEIEEHQLFPAIRAFAHQRAYEMSYGQRRKIELFRLFLRQFSVLCLDEPFNYVDVETRRIFSTYMRDHTDLTRLVVVCTHYISDLEDLDFDLLQLQDLADA